MFYAYTYDDVLYSLVTSVKDTYGYTSGTVYDLNSAALFLVRYFYILK